MRRSITLAGLCLAVFLIMVGMGMAVVALPGKYLAVAGSSRNAGWLAAAFALAYALAQTPAGRLADRRGCRGVLVAGCLLMAAAAALYALAASPLQLFVGRFIQGAGEAPVWAAAAALLGRLYPEARGRALGLYNACFHLGLVAGPLAGASLGPDRGPLPFLLFSGLCVAAALLVRLTAAEPAPVPAPLPRPEACRDRADACEHVILNGAALYGAAYGLASTTLPVLLADQAGFGPADLGRFFFCTYLGLGAAQFAAGALSDRWGRPWFMAAGLLLAGAGLAGLALYPERAALPAAGALGLGLGSFAAASLALQQERTHEGRGAAACGRYYLAWGAGCFLGPLWVDLAGPVTGCLALAAACALAASLTLRRCV